MRDNKENEKYNLDFVQSNSEEIKKRVVSNAKKLREEAELLKDCGHFCRSLFFSISALEEISKFSLLSQETIDVDTLKKAVNHKLKVPEIVDVLNKTFGTNLNVKEIVWTREMPSGRSRLLDIREDVLYVRLAPYPGHENYPLYPKESYWEKRARKLLSILDEVLERL